jgi:hypothetical protein
VNRSLAYLCFLYGTGRNLHSHIANYEIDLCSIPRHMHYNQA